MNQTLSVTGMSCQHCVKAIESSIGGLDGVENVMVNLGESKVDVKFDESRINLSKIKDEIEDQGYDVQK